MLAGTKRVGREFQRADAGDVVLSEVAQAARALDVAAETVLAVAQRGLVEERPVKNSISFSLMNLMRSKI